jgi:glycosyltransferase involved in cell wall biosynthesis
LKQQVVIDAGRASNLNSGLGQVVYQFAQALAATPPADFEFTFLLHRKFAPLLPTGFPFRITTAGTVQRLMPRLFSSGKIWHVLNPDSRSVPLTHPGIVLTIHDLRILSVKRPGGTVRYHKQLQAMLNCAAGITAISSFTKQDVINNLHVPDVPFEVIPNGIEAPLRKDVNSTSEARTPYLFSLGGFEEKKRFHLIVEMMMFLPELHLCLAGSSNNNYGEFVKNRVVELGLQDRVSFKGVISERDKWMLYANSEALVFPSKLEGFGLPVLEAMAMQKPVFASTDGALPETGGDYAYYFPSLEPEDMARFFAASMNQNQSSAGSEREAYARGFSWQRAVEQYVNFYRTLL